MSAKRSGARRCASNRNSRMKKDASKRKSAGRNGRLNARKTTRTGPEEKKSTTNGEPNVSAYVTNNVPLMTSETESGRSDTKGAGARIGTGIVIAAGQGIVNATGIVSVPQLIVLTAVHLHAVETSNERGLHPLPTRRPRQLPLWMRSLWRRLLYKCF